MNRESDLCLGLFLRFLEVEMNKPMRRCKKPGCQILTADGYCPEHKPKAARKESASWHYLYTDPRYGWKRRRGAQLAREPFCRICAGYGLRVQAADVDHVLPHRGDVSLFMTAPLQSLCHSCHSRKTVAENADVFRRVGSKAR